MALGFGSLSSRGPVCQRCLLTMSSVAGRGGPSYISRRTYATKYGKYAAKIAKAKDEWQERAAKIAGGEIPNTWDFLEERGFVKDTAGKRDTIREIMRRKRIGAYVGIDPTAPSLHVGHLLPLMPLFWMYLNGYGAYSLLGGATVRVGDPTDRLVSREPINKAELATNMTRIHFQLKKLWMNVEEQGRRNGFIRDWAWKRALVNNNVWWNKLPMLDVLKKIGTSIRIGPMLGRDTVKNKMAKGDGMSFAEFSYPIMQAWDWWHLFSRNQVQMQIGGSDQYGNIITGIDLVKIARENGPVTADEPTLYREDECDDPVGFTVPLLTDAAGVKFGKSAGNAVWLDRFMTSEFDLYGYFVRRPDDQVEKLLKLFTFLPNDTIAKVMEEQALDPGKRVAHHLLAYEVLALVHGHEAAAAAQTAHKQMYGKGQVVMETTAATAATAVAADGEPGIITLNNAPRIDIELPESLIRGTSIARILFASGLVKSASEGNRLAVQQGIYIGGAPGHYHQSGKRGMDAAELKFTPVRLWSAEHTQHYLIDGKILILRKGKHNIRVVKMVSDDEYKASGQTYPGMPYTGQMRTLLKQMKALKEGELSPEEVMTELKKKEVESDPGADYLKFPDTKSKPVREVEQRLKDLIKDRLEQDEPLSEEEQRTDATFFEKLQREIDEAEESSTDKKE